jgi:hypothetical protein
MMEFFYNETLWWLFGTAVLFTLFGRYSAFKANFEDVVATTIDSLIEEGYLKTRGKGRNMEILKHTEWCDNEN